MESWQRELDRWLTTLPDEPESEFMCMRCKEPFYPEDTYYDCDGEYLCKDCAEEWLSEQAHVATEEQCYGD